MTQRNRENRFKLLVSNISWSSYSYDKTYIDKIQNIITESIFTNHY